MPQRESDSSRKCHHYSDTLLVTQIDFVDGGEASDKRAQNYQKRLSVTVRNAAQNLFGAPDCRCYRGKLVGGEVNCRHERDIVGRHLPSKKRLDGFDMSKARRRDDRSPQPE
jgi:hypothetical protein